MKKGNKLVRALKHFTYKKQNVRPGFRIEMPDSTAKDQVSKGNVEIMRIPENRTTK